MDQNTAIVAAALLSGLLAGVLTLTGVIVQSVLTYRQTTKAEKRKEIREVIEKVYKLSSDIEMCYLQAFRHHDDEGMRLENAFQLSDNRINISMLVRLYVPALLQATEKYDKKINKDFLDKYYFDELNDREYGKSLKPVFSASEEFREALADFLQKRGYTEK